MIHFRNMKCVMKFDSTRRERRMLRQINSDCVSLRDLSFSDTVKNLTTSGGESW